MRSLRLTLLTLALALAAAPAGLHAQAPAAIVRCGADTSAAGPSRPDAGAYEPGEVERPPELANLRQVVREIERRYPEGLRREGVSGSATVRMRVNADGAPVCATVVQRTRAEFGVAALEVAPRMRFRPARVSGREVAAWVVVPVNFHVAPERESAQFPGSAVVDPNAVRDEARGARRP